MKIIIQRGVTIPFSELPQYALALDGYVQGPAVDVEHYKYSFDHHAGCIRLVTKATCAQVFDALALGLNPRKYTAYLNDIDADTVLAVWLLQHPNLIQDPLIQDLVNDVGNIDAHGPSYFPYIKDPEMCQQFFKGVMAPESRARKTGFYSQINLEKLLFTCLGRTNRLLLKKLRFSIPREKRCNSYQITHRGTGWVMVHCSERVFGAMYKEGYSRVVSYHDVEATGDDGTMESSHAYTIAKQSDLVQNFNIPYILEHLHDIESGWGGGSSIGGAPRRENGSRSFLKPDQIFDYIEKMVKAGFPWNSCFL